MTLDPAGSHHLSETIPAMGPIVKPRARKQPLEGRACRVAGSSSLQDSEKSSRKIGENGREEAEAGRTSSMQGLS